MFGLFVNLSLLRERERPYLSHSHLYILRAYNSAWHLGQVQDFLTFVA